MRKIKLSDLFSPREYKELELDFEVVKKILNKTVYSKESNKKLGVNIEDTTAKIETPKRRKSIVRRAVLYMSSVIAVFMIFVLYQNFFTQVQNAQKTECRVTGGALGTMGQYDSDCIVEPKVKEQKKGLSNIFPNDKDTQTEKLDYMAESVMMEDSPSDDDSSMLNSMRIEPDEGLVKVSSPEGGLNAFDDEWVEEEEGAHLYGNSVEKESRITPKPDGEDKAKAEVDSYGGEGMLSQQNVGVSGMSKGGGVMSNVGVSGVAGNATVGDEDYGMYYYIGGGLLFLIVLIFFMWRKKRR